MKKPVWRIFLIFIVFQVATVTRAAAAAADAVPDCAERAGQLQCDGRCRRLGVCLDSGDWMAMQDCAAQGKVCSGGRCVLSAPECSAQEARCLAEGVFPDLTDCTTYIECVDVARSRLTRGTARDGVGVGGDAGDGGDDGDTDVSNHQEHDHNHDDGEDDGDDEATLGVVHRCARGTAFDACTGRCDLIVAVCAWEVPVICAEPGTYGVAPHNDRLYYACVAMSGGRVVPYWSRCDFGHFNYTSHRCEKYDAPGCLLAPDDGETSVATTVATVPTMPGIETTTAIPLCVVGPHRDPSTDCSYLFCQPDGTFLTVNCKSGFHFDEQAGQCVLGVCDQARLESSNRRKI